MTKVIPFQGQALPAIPAYLKVNTDANDEFTAGLSSGLITPPKLGIEGGKFHVIDSDGKDVVVTKGDEDGNVIPVSVLSVVVLGSNPGKYKVYYGIKYDPNAEATRPKCYSYDGITPSALADEPQCETCAACPQNVWGSHINDLGNKTRACTDSKLLAVLPTSSVTKQISADELMGTAFSLRLSPTSLSRSKAAKKDDPASAFSWTEFMGMLNAYPIEGGSAQVPLRSVSVKLFFDLKAQYPLLQFKLGRFLTEAEVAYVAERSQGEDVKAIVQEQGQGPAPVRPARIAAPVAPAKIAPPKEDDGEGDLNAGAAVATPPRRTRGPGKSNAQAAGVAAAANAPIPAKAQVTSADMDAEVAAVAALFED
jgi:hypothetical protein